MCGILFSLVAYYVLPLGIALLSVLGAGLIAFGVLRLTAKDYTGAVAAAIAVAVVLYCSLTFLITADVRKESEYNDKVVYVVGRVTEHCMYSGDVFQAVLDDLMIDKEPVSGKMSAYLYNSGLEFSQVRAGYVLSFWAEVHDRPPVGQDGVNASDVRADIRYAAASYAHESPVPGQPDFLEGIRTGLRDHLTANMGDEAGLVAYGMIAGDRYLLPDEITDAFAGAGIGHILAVSGLHVGLIFLLINKLFSLIPAPRPIGRITTTLLLFVYAIFTGASPSTVRAVIMCLILIWSDRFGRTDSLNSLCLAATVCLCISPFYLFECGYLMSVGAVGGIVMFARPVNSALRRMRLPKPIAESIGSAVSVQSVIMPMTAYFFHRTYLYSLPVNGLGTWALSGLFFLLIAFLPLSFAFPVLLVPVGWLFGGLLFVCNWVTALPLASAVTQVGAAVFVIPILLFFASRYVKAKWKKHFAVLCFALAAVVGLSSDITVRGTDIMVTAAGSAPATVIYHGGETYLFADFTSGRSVSSALDRARVGDESFIIYEYNLTKESAAGIIDFARQRRVTEVRYAYYPNIEGLTALAESGLPMREVILDDGNVTLATSDGSPCGWLFTASGNTAFISQTGSYESAVLAADIARVRTAPYAAEFPDTLFLTSYGSPSDNIAVTSYGNPYMYDFKTGVLKGI